MPKKEAEKIKNSILNDNEKGNTISP